MFKKFIYKMFGFWENYAWILENCSKWLFGFNSQMRNFTRLLHIKQFVTHKIYYKKVNMKNVCILPGFRANHAWTFMRIVNCSKLKSLGFFGFNSKNRNLTIILYRKQIVAYKIYYIKVSIKNVCISLDFRENGAWTFLWIWTVKNWNHLHFWI